MWNSRRPLAGLGVLLASGRALAQGPKVWLDPDQKALDDAYDQAVYAPNMQQNRGALHHQQRGGARAFARATTRLRVERDRGARHLHDPGVDAPITCSSTAARGARAWRRTTASPRSHS